MKKNKKTKNKIIIIILDSLIIACLVGALYFLITPRIRANKQKEIEKSVIDQVTLQLDQNSYSNENDNYDAKPDFPISISVDPNKNKVPGESYEVFDDDISIPEQIYDDNNVIINFIGSLEIPKINLVTPIADNDSLVAIRYGVGHRAESRSIGEFGRALIFGHWFQEYGRVFNRLEEIGIGDQFTINMLDNRTRYYYRVHTVKSIDSDEIYDRLFTDPVLVDSEVVLVTCIVRNNAWRTPVGRYLVYGELINTEYIN